ncbi:MAG TPA: hypothetical protein VFX51_07470 [Solirubrobacteraceae bacterium]|nr:hypothetical protein [Solirubrobacteraceae bacterium]
MAAPAVSARCTPAPADCSGWFRSNVSLTWSVDPAAATTTGCQDETFTSDTTGAVRSCTAEDEAGSATVEVTIKRDATPPVVDPGQSRPADAGAWYTQPFTVTFTGHDDTSGLVLCPSVTYQGPDTAAGSVVGTCTDVAGNTGSAPAFTFKYDATGPDVVAAVPARPPDHAGWYTAPIGFGFLAADAFSGLASCAPASYAGPDGSAASVVGVCRDNAGNVSQGVFGFMFDATSPPISELRAVAGDGSVTVRWTTTADATSVEVLRVPGLDAAPSSRVFSGPGSTFEDHDVVNGVTYVYWVRLRDAAGNDITDSVRATPTLPSADPRPGAGAPSSPGTAPDTRPRGARLRFPQANAVVNARRPPLLRWMRVRRARYYNVQLYRGARKVLSAWPSRPRYQLRRRWSYGGKRRRLAPGRYRWYVWPGYGRPSNAEYGELLGRRAFRVVR